MTAVAAADERYATARAARLAVVDRFMQAPLLDRHSLYQQCKDALSAEDEARRGAMPGPGQRNWGAVSGHTAWKVTKTARRVAGRASRLVDEDDFTDGMTVARMAEMFTPQQAASVKARAIGLRLCSVPDPETDELLRQDAGHQWFMFCLDAVARRA